MTKPGTEDTMTPTSDTLLYLLEGWITMNGSRIFINDETGDVEKGSAFARKAIYRSKDKPANIEQGKKLAASFFEKGTVIGELEVRDIHVRDDVERKKAVGFSLGVHLVLKGTEATAGSVSAKFSYEKSGRMNMGLIQFQASVQGDDFGTTATLLARSEELGQRLGAQRIYAPSHAETSFDRSGNVEHRAPLLARAGYDFTKNEAGTVERDQVARHVARAMTRQDVKSGTETNEAVRDWASKNVVQVPEGAVHSAVQSRFEQIVHLKTAGDFLHDERDGKSLGVRALKDNNLNLVKSLNPDSDSWKNGKQYLKSEIESGRARKDAIRDARQKQKSIDRHNRRQAIKSYGRPRSSDVEDEDLYDGDIPDTGEDEE
jgi:hypothetical protein